MAHEADSELEYLSPNFDPASVTVPRLRSILVAHDVTYQSSAKKPQLIQLFNENVAPQAKRILSARSRIKPSTRRIVDVPSSQDTAAAQPDSDGEDRPPPPQIKRGKRTSKATKQPVPGEKKDDAPPPRLSAGGTATRRSSSKHGRSSEPEADERPAPRRSRHSTAPPVGARQELEPENWHTEGDDSPFTADNPFQSGSSPPPAALTSAGEQRRRASGLAEHKEKRISNVARRRTEFVGPQRDGITVPTSKTFEIPVSMLQKNVKDGSDALEPGEEFTPEEQQELIKVEKSDGRKDLVPGRSRKSTQRSTGVARIAPWAVSLAMLGGLATVWRQEKLEVGYCGIGRPSTSLAGVQIPDWASVLQPQCEPCPQHAYCYQNLETLCEQDFVLKPHPLSVAGLVPLPPTCEPDGEKARRVKAVADRAVEELRERNAKFECGKLVDESGKHIPSVEMDEQELKQEVASKRRKGMSQEEFEDLWKGAVGEILGRDEVVSGVDGTSGSRTVASTSLARIPLGCAVRRSIRVALARYLWQLIGIGLVLGSTGYARLSIASNRATDRRAKQLASLALDRLATQAGLHAQDPTTYSEAWISMSQLRDDILRDEFSASRRQWLWDQVQKKVEQNSNVRPMVREGRSGDVSRVWEWVGAVTSIEDGRNGEGSRRSSSRYSLGPTVGIGQPRLSLVKGEGNDQGVKESRNWDEGRPIY